MMKRPAICLCTCLFALGLTVYFPGVTTGASLSSASLNFGNNPQTVTVTNKGGSTLLHVGQIRIVGADAQDFQKTTTCGSELAPGAECTVTVSFLPTAIGARSASLLVGDDGGGSPQAVRLTGAGQFMALSADRTHLINTFTNQSVFITGDTAYDLTVQLTSDADVETYLADRQAKGMNLIWVGIVDPNNHGKGRDNVGTTENDGFGNNPWNGGPAFTGMSDATAYWAHVDEVLQRAAAHGITVLAGTAFTSSFDHCDIPYAPIWRKLPMRR